MADIITSPGTLVEGGSPYVIVPSVINATWNLGLQKTEEYSNKVTTATSDYLASTNAPLISPESVTPPVVSAPLVNIPASADVVDIMALYDSKYQELIDRLVAEFTTFRTTYFPNEAATYVEAETWLREAVQNPDVALPQAVQERLLESARAQVLEDASRATDTTMAVFASRGFELPPGAAVGATLEIQRKAQSEVAAGSRKLTEMRVQMQQFSVSEVMKLRHDAMGSALDYIKALASGPDIASRVANIGYDAQSKLISAASDFYRADIAAAELTSKVQQFNAGSSMDVATKNQSVQLALISDKVKALLAEAQSLAQLATALFNNIHTTAGVSGSTSNSVGYNYSNDTVSAAPTMTAVG